MFRELQPLIYLQLHGTTIYLPSFKFKRIMTIAIRTLVCILTMKTEHAFGYFSQNQLHVSS